jgi:hypothetical protein
VLNSKQMKAELLAYWRYKRQCPLVGVEVYSQDVLAVTKARQVVWVEVKVSISDLRADAKKDVHFKAAHALGIPRTPKNYQEQRAMARAAWGVTEGLPNQFYFAVPVDLVDKALKIIEEQYPYAGLLAVQHFPDSAWWGDHVDVRKVAPTLHKRKCTIKYISHLVKAITASLASAHKALVKATKETPEVKTETPVS